MGRWESLVGRWESLVGRWLHVRELVQTICGNHNVTVTLSFNPLYNVTVLQPKNYSDNLQIVRTGGDSNDKAMAMRSWTGSLSALDVNSTGNNQPGKSLLRDPDPGPSLPSSTYELPWLAALH